MVRPTDPTNPVKPKSATTHVNPNRALITATEMIGGIALSPIRAVGQLLNSSWKMKNKVSKHSPKSESLIEKKIKPPTS